MVSGPVGQDSAEVPSPLDPGDPREWCAAAVAWLGRDQPEAALEAARQAVDRDPRAGAEAGWGYRLASLAFERLGRDAEAVAAAEEAVRLAPGSWAARLRLGTALRRVPGRWRESWVQAVRAVRYAPEEPDPHVLVGDLALLRGEHRRAESAYRDALRRLDDHPGARVNLGLALLRWERPRGHHDPAWPVDPRETGRARRAMEVWSRQVRVLLAASLAVVAAVAFGPGMVAEARLGGAAVLAAVLAVTLRQAHRVRLWPYVPGMLARDPWLGMSVSIALIAVAAYVAAIATLPRAVPPFVFGPASPGGVWAVLAGLVLLNGAAVIVLRVLIEAWRGRPVRALAEFTVAHRDRTARRNIDVTLWLVAGRAWSALALTAGAALLLDGPGWASAAPAVPLALGWAHARGGLASCLRQVLATDRWLKVALVLLVAASLALGAVAAVSALGLAEVLGEWSWWAGLGALAALVAVFAARSARAWWRGVPGPWRASLMMCENCGSRLPGDVRPPVRLSGQVRRAFTHARGVVLAYADPTGPRALAVGSVSSVGPGGELRLIAADDAWQAAERDPRVAVFVADPLERRFWAEVRGVAVGDAEAAVLRVTPEHVVVGEYPGRHQGRLRPG
ncbi:tetratricopeptide (TPR) repeat protein [Streptosporangium brasiliense]|uniref:Tetratricopeptide (TPR) repeat protein n=1 Tax=Streptosporangium brasiliense TaxID=47480 RepID=A0ABT9RBT4_9ACTN|nr:tetratricopeptide (TPR) repeat protein [Streptosporangium brasiliense]